MVHISGGQGSRRSKSRPQLPREGSFQGRSQPATKSWLDQNPATKAAGGSVAQLAGNVVGTFGGEVHRNFDLGRNQGELDWDIASLLFGGAASKALRGVGSATEGGGVAKFIGQGFGPSQADYLATLYDGMGHHFLPRNALKPIQLPRVLSDSPLNVLKPTGMNRGDFYEVHYAVDPYFNAAKPPHPIQAEAAGSRGHLIRSESWLGHSVRSALLHSKPDDRQLRRPVQTAPPAPFGVPSRLRCRQTRRPRAPTDP
jgi:hypothetical protein